MSKIIYTLAVLPFFPVAMIVGFLVGPVFMFRTMLDAYRDGLKNMERRHVN